MPVWNMSLWQGVDVPGDSCRLVVMDRIPFPARMTRLRRLVRRR